MQMYIGRHKRFECGGKIASVLFDCGDDLAVAAWPQGRARPSYVSVTVRRPLLPGVVNAIK